MAALGKFPDTSPSIIVIVLTETIAILLLRVLFELFVLNLKGRFSFNCTTDTFPALSKAARQFLL